MSPPTIVYAWETGRAPANLPRSGRILDTASFDVTIPPAVPLHVGQRVAIHTLALRPVRDGPSDGRETSTYWAEPSGVEGTITGIRTMELAVTEFIVKNDSTRSLTEHAYLTIQHEQGQTVNMELWRRVVRTLLLPFLPHTRHVPLEREATTAQRVYTLMADEDMEFSDEED